jgi:hypothetical protein
MVTGLLWVPLDAGPSASGPYVASAHEPVVVVVASGPASSERADRARRLDGGTTRVVRDPLTAGLVAAVVGLTALRRRSRRIGAVLGTPPVVGRRQAVALRAPPLSALV